MKAKAKNGETASGNDKFINNGLNVVVGDTVETVVNVVDSRILKENLLLILTDCEQ